MKKKHTKGSVMDHYCPIPQSNNIQISTLKLRKTHQKVFDVMMTSRREIKESSFKVSEANAEAWIEEAMQNINENNSSVVLQL